MKDAQPRVIHLKDYQQPSYWIRKTHLTFDLSDEYTTVTSTLSLEKNDAVNEPTLTLDGEAIELISVAIDGRLLDKSAYTVTAEALTIAHPPQAFELTCITRFKPQQNTSLEGLYQSQKMYCTQCEAQGFRKITYYLDRPDVMSEFTTKIIADKQKFPVLLSNGNCIDQGDVASGRHFATWHDPFKKPCYLFALVAGDLVVLEDNFVTLSGRKVTLKIFVEEKDLDKCDHAMVSLKKSMAWDEKVFGREYDLDIFMIVAVDDFNMGAMENKGLNIFNTSCVLAKPETSTDADFQSVEAIVAHEYFHNWSGNRVTCRDWFQLSLKEGFTVFRDAEFSADMGSRTVKRVQDANVMRNIQFAEDAGPMAHPVQPPSFIEISNFYTVTIYEKGAEIVRMIHTLLGEEHFRQGSDLYFERHDGEAVTIEDFVAAMSEVSGRDFSQFMLWYQQAGTPKLAVTSDYDAEKEVFTLNVKQTCPPSPGQTDKEPFLVPLAIGLLGEAGAMPIKLQGQPRDTETSDNTHAVLEVDCAESTFIFEDVKEKPVPALLRDFSAPVKLHYRYSRDDLMRLMTQEDNGFCRWDACQQLSIQVIQEVMAALVNEPAPNVDRRLIEAFRGLLADDQLDPAMVALMLDLPSEDYLIELKTVADVDAIHFSRNRVKRKLALSLYEDFLCIYQKLHNISESKDTSSEAISRRTLKNRCLQYLVFSGKEAAFKLCEQQYYDAENMTDTITALAALVHSPKIQLADLKSRLLTDFYEKWQSEPLVLNKWFSVQASSPVADTLQQVKALMSHPAFDYRNPNKLRALLGGFSRLNTINFHHKKGSGYVFLADQILKLNSQNPQIAARLLTPLTKWRKFDENRQALMKKQLTRIKTHPDLSKDVFEVVTKSLEV